MVKRMRWSMDGDGSELGASDRWGRMRGVQESVEANRQGDLRVWRRRLGQWNSVKCEGRGQGRADGPWWEFWSGLVSAGG